MPTTGRRRRVERQRRPVGSGGGGGVAASETADEAREPSPGGAGEVLEVADQLDVAAGDVEAAAAARDRAVRARTVLLLRALSALGQHPLRLAPLRLRELSGDDDETEVDHEERADLQHIHTRRRLPLPARLPACRL